MAPAHFKQKHLLSGSFNALLKREGTILLKNPLLKSYTMLLSKPVF
jgi:hypothetical protein